MTVPFLNGPRLDEVNAFYVIALLTRFQMDDCSRCSGCRIHAHNPDIIDSTLLE